MRDQQINLYFSEEEKEQFDNLCDFYFNSSRADFIRIAMYIAVNDPPTFIEAGMKAKEEGILTLAPNRRRR